MNEELVEPVRVPENGTFELTVRCNLHCKMCFVRHDDSELPSLIAAEKTAPEWIDMAEQAARAGTLSLLITGGEPFLRDDFAEIWEGINRIGFITQLYTNATLVTPEIISLLKRYPPHRIGITLYGASEETYEKVTGNGNAYSQTIDGIKRMSMLPSLIDFRTTLIKDNLHDLEKMEEWVKTKFGHDRVLTHTNMVTKPVRGASAAVESCRLSPKENIHLRFRRQIKAVENILGSGQFDPEKVKFGLSNKQEVQSAVKHLSLFGCDAGMKDYAITYDGKLYGCQMLGVSYTQPFAVGFGRAWDIFPLTVKPVQLDPICLVCEHRDICLSCPATRYAESGSTGGFAPYICENTIKMAGFLLNKEEEFYEKEVFETNCTL